MLKILIVLYVKIEVASATERIRIGFSRELKLDSGNGTINVRRSIREKEGYDIMKGREIWTGKTYTH